MIKLVVSYKLPRPPPAVLEEGVEEGVMDSGELGGQRWPQGVQLGDQEGEHCRLRRPNLVEAKYN